MGCEAVVTKLSTETSISLSLSAESARSVSVSPREGGAAAALGGEGDGSNSVGVGMVKRRCLQVTHYIILRVLEHSVQNSVFDPIGGSRNFRTAEICPNYRNAGEDDKRTGALV